MKPLKPTRAKEYSVDLKVQISRRGRMVSVLELSTPADTLVSATNMAKPSLDALIAMIHKSKRSTSIKETK